jgi:hypothetical protein
MHLITYTSDFIPTCGPIDFVLKDIVALAQKENKKHNITGVLFFVDGSFLQVIEGEEADLRVLMANIEKDSRHKNLKYLIDTEVEARGFADWNMDSLHLKAGKSFDYSYLSALSDSFLNCLMPRSDQLVQYYKSLMDERDNALA